MSVRVMMLGLAQTSVRREDPEWRQMGLTFQGNLVPRDLLSRRSLFTGKLDSCAVGPTFKRTYF